MAKQLDNEDDKNNMKIANTERLLYPHEDYKDFILTHLILSTIS